MVVDMFLTSKMFYEDAFKKAIFSLYRKEETASFTAKCNRFHFLTPDFVNTILYTMQYMYHVRVWTYLFIIEVQVHVLHSTMLKGMHFSQKFLDDTNQ